jgi:inner membrane protein
LEPLTHALTSLALARAVENHLPRLGVAMIVVSGTAADLDYASYLDGPGAFLRIHRTALHSLPGSVFLACALAAAFVAIDKNFARKQPQGEPAVPLRFGPALATCTVGIAGHILLDLASGRGVELLWPFHTHWYEWDLATNLDPWILILLIGGLLLPHLFHMVSEEIGERKKASRGKRGAVITLLLLIAYLGVRAGLHIQAVNLLLSREYRGRVPLSAGAFPSSSSPFRWRGVAVTDTTIEEVDVPLGTGPEFDPDRSLAHFKPEDSPALNAGEHTPIVETFLRQARFPIASIDRLEDGYRLQVRDLRFAHDDMSSENIFARVELNSSLEVTREEFRFASSANP